MKLIPDWQAVLTRAWSVRLMAITVLLTGMDAATPFLYGVLPIPDRAFALLAGLTGMAAMIARHVDQKDFHNE